MVLWQKKEQDSLNARPKWPPIAKLKKEYHQQQWTVEIQVIFKQHKR